MSTPLLLLLLCLIAATIRAFTQSIVKGLYKLVLLGVFVKCLMILSQTVGGN